MAGIAALIYALLAVVLTWPLASDLCRLGVPNPDYYGNTWVLAWVTRQLGRDPLRLFDSNIYWPLPKSLVYNESLIPQALMVAPVRWLGGPPVLAHNLALLGTFPLCGWAAFRLARELGASSGGAFLTGLGFAFCPYRFKWMNNVQCLSIQWLPLVIQYLLRVARSARPLDVALLFLTAWLQALSSAYFGLLLVPALLTVGLWLVPERPSWRRLATAFLALAAAAAVTAAIFFPYLSLQRHDHVDRGLAEWAHWSARPSAYLDPGRYVGLPHLVWLRERFAGFEPLYAGAIFLGLAAFGAWSLTRSRPGHLAMALALVGALLSFGPEIGLLGVKLPGLLTVLRGLPGVAMLRTPSRLGVLALLGVALLAGLSWSAVEARWPRFRPGVLALAGLAALEAYPVGLGGVIRPLELPPASGAWLADAPPGPVLELPWTGFDEAALYVFWSTSHWQPLVDGWGSYQPRGAGFGLGLLGNRFPSEYSSRVFREHGIVYVVVHLDRVRPGQRERVLRLGPLPEGVELAAVFGDDRIYRLALWTGPAPANGAGEEVEP